jgi:hypothetical protein
MNAWACLAIGCSALALPPAAIAAYRALHGAPSCSIECHPIIPASEWSPGGAFAQGGALYGADQGWRIARSDLRTDDAAALSFAPHTDVDEPGTFALLAVAVVVSVMGRM